VRPVIFMAYSGQMRWRTKAGDEMAAGLGDAVTKDITAQAWRTALDPKGDWIPAVLRAADHRLTQVRRGVPDAGGLVIATDKDTARSYAKTLREITGEGATIVLSDEKEASDRIDHFSASQQRWMVAVRMVSEGVDVPRLAVGVYATSTSTPLFFAQAVGRFVRARGRGETASIFLPSVPLLLQLANQLELERDHALDRPSQDEDEFFSPEDALMAAANREERALGGQDDQLFEALDAQASFDRVLFDGGEFGTGGEIGSDDEMDFLGIPGLLEPAQVTELLRQRQAEQVSKRGKRAAAGPAVPEPEAENTVAIHRALKEQRQQLQSLVAAWARRSGQPHGVVHADLRRICGGPAVAQASMEQVQARIEKLQAWFVGRK
jgi:hypothetical protein